MTDKRMIDPDDLRKALDAVYRNGAGYLPAIEELIPKQLPPMEVGAVWDDRDALTKAAPEGTVVEDMHGNTAQRDIIGNWLGAAADDFDGPLLSGFGPWIIRRVGSSDWGTGPDAPTDTMPEDALGWWATHPEYGRVLCADADPGGGGAVHVVWRDDSHWTGRGSIYAIASRLSQWSRTEELP